MADPSAVLEPLLGADAIVPRDQIVASLAIPLAQAMAADSLPAAVVYPNSEAQLALVMACAHQHCWRVLPCGSGSKLAWGGLAKGIDLVVSTARLNQVVDHAVGDMTLTAQAGVTLAALAPPLAAVNQFLALDPAYPERATLGGIVASGDGGSLRQRYGGVRDMLIGLSLVRYDGQVAKAGGRVVKNVAGYDLMKLLTGSYGTLGVISQLTFRLYPRQEGSTTVAIAGSAAMQALVAAVRRSPLTPVALDLLTPALAEALGLGADLALVARFQSMAPGVEEQVKQLLAMVPAEMTTQVLTQAEDERIWAQANGLLFPTPPSGLTGPGETLGAIVKVGLRPTEAVPFLASLPTPSTLGRLHVSSGIGTLRLTGEAVRAEAIGTLRSHCEQAGGYLTLLKAPADLKATVEVWGYRGNALGVMKAIKAQFDPDHSLSPGRFVGGL